MYLGKVKGFSFEGYREQSCRVLLWDSEVSERNNDLDCRAAGLN